jgi:hypothetical protein
MAILLFRAITQKKKSVVIAIKCFLTILETVKYKLRNREDSLHGDFKVRKYNPVCDRNYVFILAYQKQLIN